MTTTTQKSTHAVKPIFKNVWIKIGDIIPTKDNTRNFDDPAKMAKLQELADNIKAKGLLQPIIVRPHPLKPGKYDLRAGERRWRAHKLAGLQKIEARVMKMSDLDAEEATFIENYHREQLTPMETARGIRSLVDSKQKQITLREIGVHLGMTPSMVLRRARLTELTKDWQKVMEAKLFPGWGVGHYESVSRFDGSIQDALLEDMQSRSHRYGSLTLKELEKALADRTRLIHLAKWSATDENLVPEAGACSKCPKRSGCKPGLFDDLYEPEKAGKKDRCLDLPCWEKKESVVFERTKLDLIKTHPGLAFVTSQYNAQGQIPGRQSYDLAKKSEKGAYLAHMEDGENKGKLIWVKPKMEEGSKGKGVKGAKKPGPTPLKDRRAAYTKRRNVHVLEALAEGVSAEGGKTPSQETILLCATVFGTQRSNGFVESKSWPWYDELAAGPKEERLACLWGNLVPVLCHRLKRSAAQQEPSMEEANRVAALVGWDLTKLHEAALAAIPDPKVWATLNENGSPKKGPIISKVVKGKK